MTNKDWLNRAKRDLKNSTKQANSTTATRDVARAGIKVGIALVQELHELNDYLSERS